MTKLLLSLLALSLTLVGLTSSAPTDAGQADLVTSLPGLTFKTNFKHYSGYLEAGNGVFLHYWFFESQTAHPEKDPVILWLNGGPGCSSMLGALSELGPIRLSRNGSLSLNPYAWNQKANVLFLESPAGVGFSYKADGHYHQDDSSTAQLNYDALRNFFEKKFPSLAENEFYLTGESYAGIYIPTLSMQLLKHKFPKNFKGAAIGNAYLDTNLLGNSVLHFYYYHGMLGSFHWDSMIKACCKSADIRKCDIVGNPDHACAITRNNAAHASNQAKLNHYNIYDECRHDPTHNSTVLSYDQVMNGLLLESLNVEPSEFYASGRSPPCLSQDYLAQFLNNAETKKAMHISAKSREWGPCQSDIGYHRELHSMKSQVKHMVDAGLKVLIYNGDVDSVCNFIGDEWFVQELNYRVRVDYHPLIMGDSVIGFSTFYDKQLTFMTIRGAGHMVPEDKPKEALFMFNTFLTGRP